MSGARLTTRLIEARGSGATIAVAETGLPPTEAAAYEVQRAVQDKLGAIGGWKVGAAGPHARPSTAPLPAAGILPAPADLPPAYTDRLVEAEIAFKIGRDLPPREAPWNRTEILAAIGSCHPAVEVVQWRIPDWRNAAANLKLADGGGHGALLVGEAIPDWQRIDFATLGVTQEIDGGPAKSGIGNPAGDMIRLIVWLADEGAVWAGGLRAGQIVTCGSWTGITEALAGAAITVTFAGIRPVRLRFQPAAT